MEIMNIKVSLADERIANLDVLKEVMTKKKFLTSGNLFNDFLCEVDADFEDIVKIEFS